jgi:Holliday junction DNA helicase RuvA
VGKKTAERVVLELKDRVGVAAAWEAASTARTDEHARLTDALLALLNLGFKQVEAQKALREVQKERPEADTETYMRQALKKLA